MLTLELSSNVLEIPNYAYKNTLNHDWLLNISQEYCKLTGLCWKIMRRQLQTLISTIRTTLNFFRKNENAACLFLLYRAIDDITLGNLNRSTVISAQFLKNVYT